MAGITIREATLDDKEAVLAIHDHVYDGRDYLPQFYDEILSSPSVTAFVLVHEETIIGFKAALLVDEGSTFVSRAARISPKYEGKGLFRMLDKYVSDWARSKNIKRKALITANVNENASKQSFQEAHKLICKKVMLTYFIDQKSIKLKDSDMNSAMKLTEVSDESFVSYIESQEISKYLFPHDRIIVNWIPFMVMKSNIPLMKSFKFTNVYSDVSIESGACEGLLSTGTLYPVKEPSFLLNLEIYGRSWQSLRSHLVRHLMVLKEKTTGITNVLLFSDGGCPPEKIMEVFLELGSSRQEWRDSKNQNMVYSEQFLYEKDL